MGSDLKWSDARVGGKTHMATRYGTDRDSVVLGTARDDDLFGLRGGDTLFGLGGDDTLHGGRHSDVLNGGPGFDVASYVANTTPVFADLRSGIVRFPDTSWGKERLTGIEAIEGGSADDRLFGDGHANALFGHGGHDTLFGGVGADTLLGGTGNDSLDGGTGNNTLLGGHGDDYLKLSVSDGRNVLNGGVGHDAAVLLGNSNLWVNLNRGAVSLADEPRTQLLSIERLLTGSGADTVIGTAGADDISVGDGANVVYAGAGDDLIFGGSQGDGELLNGGVGNDTIYGGGQSSGEADVWPYYRSPAQETLAGGAGDDYINCGWGSQLTASGGPGADTFSFGDDDDFPWWFTTATITDFEISDRISWWFSDDLAPYSYMGEVDDPSDLDIGEIGYLRDGDDTHLLIRHGYYVLDLPQLYSDITLRGYQGPLDWFGVSW